MSKELVQHIMSLLQSGVCPLLKLSPRRGGDYRLIRVTDTDNYRFYGVFADDKKEEKVVLPHTSIIHGTLKVEEVQEMVS